MEVERITLKMDNSNLLITPLIHKVIGFEVLGCFYQINTYFDFFLNKANISLLRSI